MLGFLPLLLVPSGFKDAAISSPLLAGASWKVPGTLTSEGGMHHASVESLGSGAMARDSAFCGYVYV